MYHVELDIVKNIKRKYNETLASSADEHQIIEFSKMFYDLYKCDAPKAYLEFLRQCNGFEFNGCIIYGTRTFFENQLDYDFLTDNYVIFAEYDIGWFCLERSSGKLCELDKPSAEVVSIFDSLEKMIKYVLSLATNM